MVYKSPSFYLLPSYCVLCRQVTTRHKDLCQPCEDSLPHNICVCLRCALPMSQTTATCGQCQTQLPAFDKTVAAFEYKGELPRLIHALKYKQRLEHARVLSSNLLGQIQQRYYDDELPQQLLPVPMHWRRLIKRGGNQALEIARWLAADLRIAVKPRLLIRAKYTPAQAHLNRKERLINLKDAFVVKRPQLLARHIALVDDVMTTGATALQLAKLLKQQGVARVDVWVLARTPRNH